MTLYCRSNESRQINVYYKYYYITFIIKCCESDDNMWLSLCEFLIADTQPNHHFIFLPPIQLNLQLPASPSKKGVSLSRFLPNKSCKRTFCSDCVRTSDIKLDLEHANDGPCLVVSWSHANLSQTIGYPIIILATNSLYSHIFVTHIPGSWSLKPMKCSQCDTPLTQLPEKSTKQNDWIWRL